MSYYSDLLFLSFCRLALQSRVDLENHSVDAATTSEAVGFITLMQELKRKVRSWEQKVEVSQSTHAYSDTRLGW